MADFGGMIARRMGRDSPFAAAAVSQWLKGVRVPDLPVIQAIADLTGISPGVLAFGENADSVPTVDPALFEQLTTAATPKFPERAAPAKKSAAPGKGRRRA